MWFCLSPEKQMSLCDTRLNPLPLPQTRKHFPFYRTPTQCGTRFLRECPGIITSNFISSIVLISYAGQLGGVHRYEFLTNSNHSSGVKKKKRPLRLKIQETKILYPPLLSSFFVFFFFFFFLIFILYHYRVKL
jgi:hypothetical protein